MSRQRKRREKQKKTRVADGQDEERCKKRVKSIAYNMIVVKPIQLKMEHESCNQNKGAGKHV